MRSFYRVRVRSSEVPSLRATARSRARGCVDDDSRCRMMSARSTRRAPSPSQTLLAHQHRDGFALQVDVRLATDVDGDAPDRPTGESPRLHARIVVGDAGAPVAPDAEPLARDHELPGLRLDRPIADLRIAVPERERSGRHAGRVLAARVERRRQDLVLTNWQLLDRDDLLLEHADEAVYVMESVVLHVKG